MNDMKDLVVGGAGGGDTSCGAEPGRERDFFPFRPHLLLALKLSGFFSFLSALFLLLSFSTAAILASISAFFLRTRSACSDMATSLLTFPSFPPAL